ncbi:MmcQ/YjbR family DNA-binding protein [Nocardioides stalactiti]|uniref:MmcQ/YjbR family DNA-binding protein n=1 Tax=Nocardioides stalactiti TaxID=2755356 RepID=UPI0015FF367E|nr:MmcQ/YjbR family DNA-binding protein [Nocardioides stalactiti]
MPTPPTLDDVAALATALPEVTETVLMGDWQAWAVKGKTFAWERPFSKADLKRYGDETPPSLPVLAVRTDGLVEKEAILADPPEGVFTIPHFNGYAAVLVELDRVGVDDLRELVVSGWFAMAPKKLADSYRAEA